MRTVVVHLCNTTPDEVGEFIRHTYPRQQGPPWIAEAEGDACLYINQFHPEEEACDYEPQTLEALVVLMGGNRFVSVSADVSGRHDGTEQVRQFVGRLLTRYGGVARDDYTDHFWTWSEITSGHLVQNHPFFDYAGWHAH